MWGGFSLSKPRNIQFALCNLKVDSSKGLSYPLLWVVLGEILILISLLELVVTLPQYSPLVYYLH